MEILIIGGISTIVLLLVVSLIIKNIRELMLQSEQTKTEQEAMDQERDR
jgi:hypothetical protein